MAVHVITAAYQSAISFAKNATLVDKNIISDGAAIGRSDEAETLLVREPFDASLHFVRHGRSERWMLTLG